MLYNILAVLGCSEMPKTSSDERARRSGVSPERSQSFDSLPPPLGQRVVLNQRAGDGPASPAVHSQQRYGADLDG